MVADKIARQLRKYKERRQDKKTHAQPKTEVGMEQPVVSDLIGDRTGTAKRSGTPVLPCRGRLKKPWNSCS